MYSNEFKILFVLILINMLYSYFKGKSLEKMTDDSTFSPVHLTAIKNLGNVAASMISADGGTLTLPYNVNITKNLQVNTSGRTGQEPLRIYMGDNKYYYFNTDRHEIGIYKNGGTNSGSQYIQLGSFNGTSLRVDNTGEIRCKGRIHLESTNGGTDKTFTIYNSNDESNLHKEGGGGNVIQIMNSKGYVNGKEMLKHKDNIKLKANTNNMVNNGQYLGECGHCNSATTRASWGNTDAIMIVEKQ